MRKIFYCAVIIFFAMQIKLFAQDSNPDLTKIWTILEFIENGKKLDYENMVEIVVDFQSNGTYNYWEENDVSDGTYEYTDGKIIFDKGTEDEMIWNVNSLSAEELSISYKEGKTSYKFIFKPKVKQD